MCPSYGVVVIVSPESTPGVLYVKAPTTIATLVPVTTSTKSLVPAPESVAPPAHVFGLTAQFATVTPGASGTTNPATPRQVTLDEYMVDGGGHTSARAINDTPKPNAAPATTVRRLATGVD